MVKLEWQCGWEEWQSPILDAFADSEEEVCCGNIVRLRKRTANNSKKRKRGTVERNEWENLSSPKLASVVETVPKQLVSEDKNENTEPSQLATIIPDSTPISEETQVNHPPSEETKESTVGEETFDSNNVGISKDVALPPTLTNNNRHTLWQRLSNALEKRCKQYSLEGFSPPGFVVDTVPDLKVSLFIELYENGYIKDSRRILYPYDQHSKRLVEALDLGLIPPYEDLPTNHPLHYYQGCLIAEIRDFRSSFQGFLQTSMKASGKAVPIVYKLILRPDFHTILSDIDRAITRAQSNKRIESEMKMQLEQFLLPVLFRNIHWDGHIQRFYYLHPMDSFKWNTLRRPRMTTKNEKGVLRSWKELCRRGGYLSPSSIVLYVCMLMESFLTREKSMEETKTLKSSKVDGRRVTSHSWLSNTNHSTLPNGVDELAWKPFQLRRNNNLEVHRCALYSYKRNICLSKSNPVIDDNPPSPPSHLHPDVLRVMAFSLARKNTLTSATKKQVVNCTFQIVKLGSSMYYCESNRSNMRNNSTDRNSFTSCSLKYAMDFADNFRRISELEGYICILDSFRGPFDKRPENPSESIPEKTLQKRSSNVPNHPPSFYSSSTRMDSAANLQLSATNSASSFVPMAQAQPGVRPVAPSYYYSSNGNAARASAYGKHISSSGNHSTNVLQNSGSFYQGVEMENRTRSNIVGSLHANQPIYPASSTSTTLPPQTSITRGPKPIVSQNSAHRTTTLPTALGIPSNDNRFTGNTRASSPVHSSTSSFHGSNRQ